MGVALSTASQMHRSRVASVGIGRVRGLLADDSLVAQLVKALAVEHVTPVGYARRGYPGLSWLCEAFSDHQDCRRGSVDELATF